MLQVKLQNISFNKLKEFTSLGNKKNITIKGRFTLIGEYEIITKDKGDAMTIKQLAKQIEDLKQIMLQEFAKLWSALDKVIEINNLKSYK